MVTYIGCEGSNSEHEEADDERSETVFVYRLNTTEIVHANEERAGRSQACRPRVDIVRDGSVECNSKAGVRTQPYQHHHLKQQQHSLANSMQ